MPEKKEVDFEVLLEQVGSSGRYQVIMMAYFVVVCLINSYIVYSPVFFLYVPDQYTCTEGADQSSDSVAYAIAGSSSEDSCQLVNATINHDGELLVEERSCPNGFDYNLTGLFTSAATDMDWVCENSWKGPFTQSIFYVGSLLGILFFGYTSDKYGRFPTFYVTNIITLVTGLATPSCTSFWSFTLIRFLMGLSFDLNLATFLTLTIEIVSVQHRSLVITLGYGFGFTLGGMYSPWLLKYLADWKVFMYVLFGQVALVLTTPLFVHESVRWLMSQGNVEKSLDILHKIAKTNGKTLPDSFSDDFRLAVSHEQTEARKMQRLTWLDLFKTPVLRKCTILVILAWMVTFTTFDGHIRNVSNLNTSFYMTFTIAAALELPADLLVAWSINNLGRRWSVACGHFFAGSSMMLCAIFINNATVLTVFSMIGRFWITYAMTSCNYFIYEIFPTTLRSQGSSLATVFASGSQFFSPYIVYSSVFHPLTPFLILGTLSLGVSVIPLFLPETAGVDLPQTIDQAEEFAKTIKFFAMPLTQVNNSKGESASKSN